MPLSRAALLTMALSLHGPTVHAADSLDDLLGARPGGAQAQGKSVFKSAVGEWRLLGDGNSAGLDCAVGFRGEAGFFGLIGPTSDAKGALLFMSPQIAPVARQRDTKVTLVTDKDPPGHVAKPRGAVQLASAEGVLAVSTDMAATLRGIADVKRMTLEHEGRQVLDLKVDGVWVARDALARCMGMAPIGGKE